jgi:hypothetical protein
MVFPVDVYGEGITTYDGLSFSQQFTFKGLDNELQWYYGSFDNENSVNWKAKGKYVSGLVFTSSYD